MSQELKSSDIVGFKLLLSEVLSRSNPDDDVRRALGELERFCAEFRRLDLWKLKYERAGRWQPGQPCMHRGSPCVVVSVSATRVMVQKWMMPAFKLDQTVTPKAAWLDPANLTAIHTRATWDTWRGMMEFCGQRVSEWTTTELRERMEGL
jgi:hypothetical protein